MAISRNAVLDWLRAYAGVLEQNRDYLTQLDAAIGDADHGANMDRGFRAVVARIPEMAEKDVGAIFRAVGMVLVSTVGGAAGPLYGTFFIQAGAPLAGKVEIAPADWLAALEAGVKGVMARGKAVPGDKTMVDALTPALEAARLALNNGKPFAQALRESAAAAYKGAEDTIPIVARRGRASYLGERSAGHQDPGATSSAMLLTTAANVFGARD